MLYGLSIISLIWFFSSIIDRLLFFIKNLIESTASFNVSNWRKNLSILLKSCKDKYLLYISFGNCSLFSISNNRILSLEDNFNLNMFLFYLISNDSELVNSIFSFSEGLLTVGGACIYIKF